MNPSLFARWSSLWKRLGATGDAQPIYTEIVMHYCEPGRYYHVLQHIKQGLDEFDEVRHLFTSPDAVEFAWWMHDIIMVFHKREPGVLSNEERSAAFAKNVLVNAGACLGLQKVATAIRVTAHKPDELRPITLDEQLILDIDLSIFGQSEKVFDTYELHIRAEYEHIDERTFLNVRRGILEGFLKRPNIYYSDHFRAKYEDKARKNLERSVESLKFSIEHPFL